MGWASHYWHTPEAGGTVDKDNPTQVGRALHRLGIELIRAYSPEAKRLTQTFGHTLFNTDLGSQFAGFAFTARLREAGIRISMDGRGRFMDNIFIERLRRSLEYEAIWLHEIADGLQARRPIRDWIAFYNAGRPHAALGGRTPAEAYRDRPPVDTMDKPLRALPTSPQAQQQQQEDRFKRVLAA